MTSGSQAIWARMGLEFLVVVLGILAAIAVDDWRQARADRGLEEYLLSSLLSDLEADSADAARQVVLEQADRDAVDHLLTVLGHPYAPDVPVRGMAVEEVGESLDELWSTGEVEVSDATFSEMVSTGSFRVIRDRALRRAISTYYQGAERLLAIPRRQVDPRPDLLSALAGVGIVPGYSGRMPDLIDRLRSDPAIATHALRIRRYYDLTLTLNALAESRRPLMESVRAELQFLR